VVHLDGGRTVVDVQSAVAFEQERANRYLLSDDGLNVKASGPGYRSWSYAVGRST